MADTQFYKDHAFKEFKLNAGGGSQGVGTSGSISAMSISGKTLGTQNVSLQSSGSGKYMSIQLRAGGVTLAQYSLSSYYESAYEAGKDDCPGPHNPYSKSDMADAWDEGNSASSTARNPYK